MLQSYVTKFKQLGAVSKIGIIGGIIASFSIFGAATAEPPITTTKNIMQTESILYETKFENNSDLELGKVQVKSKGINGEKQVVYSVTYADGSETDKIILSSKVTKEPVNQISYRGTLEKLTITDNEVMPFASETVYDASIESGKTNVTRTGVNGTKSVVYNVTRVENQETSRTKVSETVSTAPISRVITIGTKKVSSCAAGYSPCLPITYDLNCDEIGLRVSVFGNDQYGLDRDSDGVGCESY